MSRLAVFFLALALSLDAFAQAQQVRPGLWEISMNVAGAPPLKQTTCITPEMAKDMGKLGRQSPQESDCKNTNDATAGKTRSFHMSCTKPQPYDADIKSTYSSQDEFTMAQNYTMDIQGQRQKGSMNFNYRRVGDCGR